MEENQTEITNEGVENQNDPQMDEYQKLVESGQLDADEELMPKKEEESPEDTEEESYDDETNIDNQNKDVEDGEEEEEEEPQEPKKERKERPERYIPMSKWKQEREKHQQEKAELEEKLRQFEKSQEDKKDDEPTENPANNDVAETVKKTLESMGITDIIAENKKIAEEKHFDNEFNNDIMPIVKKQYPHATQEQIEEARAVLDDKAHSEDYYNTSLDYVFFKEKDTIHEVLGGNKPRKSVEDGYQPTNVGEFNSQVSGKDLKPDSDFSFMNKLTSAQKEKIENTMSLDTWEAYADYMEHGYSQLTMKQRKI